MMCTYTHYIQNVRRMLLPFYLIDKPHYIFIVIKCKLLLKMA